MSIVRWSHAFLAAAILAACGSVDDRPECSSDAQCAAGAYCATASGVCWPDAVAPTVSGVTVTCAGGAAPPCLRDGSLRIAATARDDVGVSAVTARIGLDETRPVALTCTGTSCAGTVALAAYPFNVFEGTTDVRVTVRDRAGNEVTSAEQASPNITRLRWVATLDTGVLAPTSPAIKADGTIVLGATNGRLYWIGANGSPAHDALPVGGAAIISAPAIGETTVYVGNEGGNLYAVALDGSAVLNGPGGCSTGGPNTSGPAVRTLAGDSALAGSGALALVAADPECNSTDVGGAVSAPPVVATDGTVYVAANQAATAILQRVSPLTIAPWLRLAWNGIASNPAAPTVGSEVRAPMAVDAAGAVWSVSVDGQVRRTTSDAVSSSIGAVGNNASGIVILADGSAVIGDGSNRLKRFAASGTPPWTETSTLLGIPQVPLVMTGDVPTLIVPTAGGRLYAIRTLDGTVAWDHLLSSITVPLRSGNVQPTSTPGISTAYFPAADGRLFAIIVDGRLDTAAPWPKIFHDPRNTNNAGTVLP